METVIFEYIINSDYSVYGDSFKLKLLVKHVSISIFEDTH